MTIQWAKDATRQLAAAHGYVAADGPGAAERLLSRITQTVKQLSTHRHAGREGRIKNTRELVIVNTPYIVAYRIKNESNIQVLAVLHGKRRWPESF
jgi:addiction module RelE/StbE family toxin